jgi:hypothetical protein
VTHQSGAPGDVADRLRSALARRDLALLEPVLADDVLWGSCVGRSQVAEYLARVLATSVEVELVDLEAHADRLVATLELSSPRTGEEPGLHGRISQVLFVHEGRITELQDATDRDEALAATPSPKPPPPPDTMATLNTLAAVLPVRDLPSALDHYRQLGFAVRAYTGAEYGFADRDGVSLHLTRHRNLDPNATTSTVYLYVDDADALFAEWRSSGVEGQFFAPHDTEYGLREGAHIDRDGNLLRFGSPL